MNAEKAKFYYEISSTQFYKQVERLRAIDTKLSFLLGFIIALFTIAMSLITKFFYKGSCIEEIILICDYFVYGGIFVYMLYPLRKMIMLDQYDFLDFKVEKELSLNRTSENVLLYTSYVHNENTEKLIDIINTKSDLMYSVINRASILTILMLGGTFVELFCLIIFGGNF